MQYVVEELGLLGVGDEVGDVEEGGDVPDGVVGEASQGQRRGGPLPLLLGGGRRVLGRRVLHCCCCWLQFEAEGSRLGSSCCVGHGWAMDLTNS